MENILFVSYYFPPLNSPGTNRTLQFIKNVKTFNYNPIVLTIDENAIKKSSYSSDLNLNKEIPSNISIIRTKNWEPTALKKTLTQLRIFRLFWFIFYPIFWESAALWPFAALSKARREIKKNNIKIIYTTSGPFSSMFLGALLKLTTSKTKWVADLRDPFTDGYMWQFPSKTHWYFSRLIEKILFLYADKIIVNTPTVKELYTLKRNIKAEKITVITNGF